MIALNTPLSLPSEITVRKIPAQLIEDVSPTMTLGEVVIFPIAFVDHRSPALSKKPLFGNHDSERRVTGIVLLVDKAVRKGNHRSFGKAYAGIVAFDISCTGDKSSLINNFLEPLECIFVILSAGEMNEKRGNIDSADARNASSGSPPFELARLLMRLNHVASFIVNANHGIV